jgi:hypothetical protein
MSITLPGSTQVASLPTSFSGKLGAGTTERALPVDMAQCMPLSACEEPSSLRWQQHQLQQQQQQLLGGLPSAPQHYHHHQQQVQQQQGGQETLEAAGGPQQGLGSRLKMLLRGKKAKARRSLTVGAGGSFTIGTATSAAGTTRIPSADAVLAVRKASAGSTSQFLPQAPPAGGMGQFMPQAPLAAAQQQMPCGDAGAAAGRARSVPGGFLLQDSTPHVPVDRQWHSLFMPPTPCDPHTVAATVGGLSWHADMSTGFTGVQMSGAAATGMQQMPGHQPQWQGMGHPGMGQHTVAAAPPSAPAGPAGLPVGGNVLSGDGGFAQQLALLRATYANQLLEEEDDDEFGGVADPAGAQGLNMPSPAVLAGGMGLPHSSAGTLRQGQSPFGTSAAGMGVAEGTGLGSVRVDDRPGFMGRLTRALKLGSSRSSQNLAVSLPPAASTNMDGDNDDEDLLITGRCDGELQLAKAALHWQAGGEVSTQDFVAALHAGGLGSAGVKLEQGTGV